MSGVRTAVGWESYESMHGPERWLDRQGFVLPAKFDERDYPNHHVATIRCKSCETTWDAVYPKGMDVAHVECYNCGTRDSEVAKYTKFIYKQ